ncbi:MAG: sulfite exporter TauE/SafE family protein [Actinobacteria bacterium]|nr:sulfite exporter TauE/SafE family protein [Actinomycetota bacterium]
MDWEFVLAGLFTGLLVGTTGMGGGSLMTPILVFLFGIAPATAIGTDIAHGAAFKTVSAVQHRRMGNVRARLAGWMLIGSAPTSLVGVWLAEKLTDRYGDDAKSVMAQVLGAALLFGCVGLIAKSLIHTSPPDDVEWQLSRRDRVAAVVIGALGGFIVGLTSVGSGVFFGLTLLVIFPLRAHKVVGTDIFHAAVLLYIAGAAHWAAGNVDFGILFWLLLGSIPGVLVGGRLTLSIPEHMLRLTLAGVLGLAGIKLLDVPGSGVIVVVALSAGLVALLVFLGRHSWIRIQQARASRPAAMD